MQAVLASTNIENLRKAVDKCYRMKMDTNDDEIVAGEFKWEYLTMRKGMLIFVMFLDVKRLILMFHAKEDNRGEMSRFSERRTTKKEK